MVPPTTLKWTVQRHEDGISVVFGGSITERVDFAPLLEQLAGASGTLTLDTYEVGRINSVGVARWIDFMSALDRFESVQIVRCSPAMVTQANMIANFFARAGVRSVAAPFYCPRCDIEELRIIEIPEKVLDPEPLAGGPQHCDREGPACQMQFDDLPERYFRFTVD